MATTAPVTSHLFLSYATADRERALTIADALEAAGIPVWIDRRGIPGGTDWAGQIALALRACRAVAVLCSAASVVSRNVRQELQLAWDHNKPILPLLLEQVEFPDAVAYFLQGRQWIEIVDRTREEWLPPVIGALSALGVATDAEAAPPSAAAPAIHSVRLPSPLTALLGRDVEIRQVAALATAHRLVTLTGPGGVGKTRLAIEAARVAAPEFPDGVTFIDLSPVREPDLVLPTVARVLGLPEAGTIEIADALASAIGERRALLVLDNFEQVLDAAPEVAALLAACPNVTVLVTSRAPLAVRGEQNVPVGPLPSPEAGLDPSKLSANPGVAVFVERAREAHPALETSQSNLETIAAICRRLEGLPLAIELAAARTRVLSPAALLARLEQVLPTLTSGPRDLPDRQRTLRDAIGWSYQLLAPEEQTLFQYLAVFVGGWTSTAAESVAGAGSIAIDIVDGIASLVDKSLVVRVAAASCDEASAEPRFVMLETIREFALDALAASGEENAVRRAHASYFLAEAELAEPELRGRGQSSWIARLETELPNLRAVLDWSLSGGDAETGLRLAGALHWFWFLRNHVEEGRVWFERARDVGSKSADSLGKAALGASMLAWRASDYKASAALCEDALGLFATANSRWGLAMVIHQQGHLAEDLEHDHERASRHFTDSIARFEEIDDPWGVAFSQRCLGRALTDVGRDYERATILLRRALATFKEIGDNWNIGVTLHMLGDAALVQELWWDAIAAYQESMLHHWAQRDSLMVGDSLLRLAQILAALSNATLAVRFFGAAEAQRERASITVYHPIRIAYEQAVDTAREQLTEEQFRALWEAGRQAPLAELVEAARAIRPNRVTQPGGPAESE